MVNLVHLTIDNKPITVPAGTTILEQPNIMESRFQNYVI